jgi:hypothetical protein
VPFSARIVRATLTSKLGCELENTHHKYYFFYYNGQLITKTRVSQGRGGEIDDYLAGQMARQLKIGKPLFAELVSCTKEYEDYVDALREDGHIS